MIFTISNIRIVGDLGIFYSKPDMNSDKIFAQKWATPPPVTAPQEFPRGKISLWIPILKGTRTSSWTLTTHFPTLSRTLLLNHRVLLPSGNPHSIIRLRARAAEGKGNRPHNPPKGRNRSPRYPRRTRTLTSFLPVSKPWLMGEKTSRHLPQDRPNSNRPASSPAGSPSSARGTVRGFSHRHACSGQPKVAQAESDPPAEEEA